MSINFIEMLKRAINQRASDLHISTGNLPAIRVNGNIQFVSNEMLTDRDVDEIAQICLDDKTYKEFKRTGDVDSSITIKDCGRVRVNAFKQMNGTSIVLRIINENIPQLKDLNIPESIAKVLELKEGLVLVTGPTGCGKSTTLAAIINEMNKMRKSHIITIEEPIEYIQKSKNCVINQREIGNDCVSYARALKAALREDPDIVLLGEMRDLESISTALTAAETGHLVLSTLHTVGAAKSVDRLVDVFPAEQQKQIAYQLSLVLKAVISQRLLPRADGKGRVAAFEIMFVNSAISNLIRESRTANINQIIQTSMPEGMILLNKSIDELVKAGLVTPEVGNKYTNVNSVRYSIG